MCAAHCHCYVLWNWTKKIQKVKTISARNKLCNTIRSITMAYNSMAEDRFDADDKWDLDPFEDDSSRIAGDQKVIEMKEFVEKHAEKLYDIEQTLDETLGAEWDADSDQIGLFMQPYEQVSMLELISTRNTLFNKVMVVFASLCEEINVLKEQASAKFYPGLTLFGQETAAQDASAGAENAEVVQLYNNGVSEGDIQIQLGKMLPFLQELYQFVQRCYELLKNMIRQLGALYAKDQKLYQTSFKNVHLRTVFDHLGELLTVLITLDEILTQNSALPIGWGSYKRMIKTIKKEPAKYGMDEQQLYQFEKLMFQIKGLLLEGLIFQNAVEQEFDDPGVCEVRSNAVFKREFQLNLEGIVELVAEKEISLDDNLRKKYIAACGLFALFHTLFASEKNNAKLAKTLWELQKEFPIVHLLGPVTWSPANFLTKCVPQLLKQIKAQRLDAQRLQYLATLDKEFAARVRMFYLRINKWLVQMNSDCNPQTRLALLLKGLTLAQRISTLFKTVLYLHTETAQAIKANMILPLFQCVELLKAIHACVHSRATLISAAVPKLIRALAHTAGTKLARAKQQRESSGQKLTPALLDQIAALHAALQALNGPGSSGRLLVARLSAALLPQEEVAWLWPALLRIETLAKFGPSLLAATDCSFLFYSKDLIGAYLRVIYQQPQLVDKLPYLMAALRDIVPVFYRSVHVPPKVFLDSFKKEVETLLQEELVEKLCREIETDLRLHVHNKTAEVNHFNPFKNGIRDLSRFLNLRPLRFYDMHLNFKARVSHYLDTTFYDVNAVALFDWQKYGEMRNLAREKYALNLAEVHLPGQTLEQGLDVLVIMRNIHTFVTRYNYNMNNQIFIEQQSADNKTLNTINIQHIANSIRTHGIGMMNTTVNFTFQFLKQKFKTFSQFLFDDIIKSRLFKDVRYFTEQKETLDSRYPVDRAEKFIRDLRKLGVTEDKMTFLDKFRTLITEIGNAMGFVRMIRSGGLLYTSNTVKFVPDLQGIEKFEELCQRDHLSPETAESAKNLDLVIETLTRNFAEGTEYFKMLVSVFQSGFRSPANMHLKNFYAIVPPLTLNYVDHMLVSKEKFSKKGKGEGVFTDDGFAMGVAYILKLLDQTKDFAALHWFDSVMSKYRLQEKEVQEKKDNQDIKTLQLTVKKLKGFREEFELLHYSMTSAQIFFQYED